MTSVFLARRRAEEFAAALDGGAGSAPAHPAELTGLVGLAHALESRSTTVVPRQAFTADLRERLMREAETVLRPAQATLTLPTRPRGARERRLVAAASALVVIGGTAGVAAAAQGSLPGEVLYPVKRGIEQAEAGLSVSTAGKGHDLLDQANHRLHEVGGLLGSDRADDVPRVSATLDDFSAQAAEGAALLFASYEETRDPADVNAVRTFAADGMLTLQELAEQVPTQSEDALASAALVLRDLDQRATRLCGGCAADLPSLDTPGIFLASAEVDRALLLAATAPLSNSHPVVVPRPLTGTGTGNGTEAPADDAGAPGAGGDGEAAPTPAPSAPGPTTPTGTPTGVPTLDPVAPGGDLPSLLPQKTEQAAGGEDAKKDAGQVAGKVVKDVTDGVSGAVETLLPDVDPLS